VTIKEDIKQQIIQLSKEGKGRNQIFHELSLLNVNVSSGTISNVLNQYKNNRNHITNMNNTSSPSSTAQREGLSLSSEPDVDFADISYQEDYPPLNLEDLEVKKDLLLKQIEENQRVSEANRKAADAFLAVKEEMAKYSIEDGSIQFVKVIQTFRKYGHDPSKIFNSFLEVQDVVIEKEHIKRLSEETDHKLRVLERKLEEIGLGDFENLRKIVVSLMTLETYGIGVDQIISYYHRQRNQQILARTRGGRV
jgi:hypothetical protein